MDLVFVYDEDGELVLSVDPVLGARCLVDLGRATGQDVAFSGAEMHALETAITGFGDSLHMEGICAGPVVAPDDATRQQRILATLGRRP